MNWLNLLIVFIAGTVGSTYGTLVGGTSLVTLPLLMFLGLPPHVALGTDRLGVAGLSLAGWYKFHEKGLIDYRIGMATGLASLAGAFLGANLVMEVSVVVLKKVIAAATLGGLFIVAVKPRIGVDEKVRPVAKGQFAIGLMAAFCVGVYGGFFGVMAGTFSIYVLLFIFRQSFLHGIATAKISAFMLTTIAAAVLAFRGAIHFPMACALFFGCGVGSYVGAHYSDRIGNVWIKRFFIVMVLVMAVKLLLP
jgi:uncharacterized membrane protein YfcA